MVTGEFTVTTVIGSSVASRTDLLSVQLTSGLIVAHAPSMRTPSLPKRAPWTEEDAEHLEKVLATFPPWNSDQIAVARRCFGAAQARIEGSS